MFLRRSNEIKELIHEAVRSCPDYVRVANLDIPEQANDVHINHLVVRMGEDTTFVSLWASRVLATRTQVRLSLLNQIQEAMTDNKAVQGWIFQTEFICQVSARAKMNFDDKWITLKQNKVNCTAEEHESLNVSKYSRFLSVPMILRKQIIGGAWLVPVDPHHAGYDVAWIREEKATQTTTGPKISFGIVFLQLTVGKRHSLDEKHLLSMVQHLRSTLRRPIATIQVYFVLNEASRSFRVEYVENTELASMRKPYQIRVLASK